MTLSQPSSYRHLSPRQAAQEIAKQAKLTANSTVLYQSSGRLLIICSADQLAKVSSRLNPQLQIHAVLLNGKGDAPEPVYPFIYADSVLSIEGYLGAFQVVVTQSQERTDLGHYFNLEENCFDLVLDLSPHSILQLEVLPPGYFTTWNDDSLLDQSLTELNDMIGEFEKPKFFSLIDRLCAHSSSGITGCTNCLDACPASAISSQDHKIVIEPHLCQGCGTCSTVCPSGAISYAYPNARKTIQQLQKMLNAWFDAEGKAPTILFHNSQAGATLIEPCEERIPEHILPFQVEETASIGIDVWLSALACGAENVVLLLQQESDTSGKLQQQITYASQLLQGIGYQGEQIHLHLGTDPEKLIKSLQNLPAHSSIKRARLSGLRGKRNTIRMAMDHLQQQAKNKSITVPDVIPLEAGAPFGDVQINPERCTLCMACVTVCPQLALADGGNKPQLWFKESACVQCGLCETSCPEQAITLIPRYNTNSDASNRPRLLHEEIIFNCIECGKPFATQKMIKGMTEKLKTHPMFKGEGLRRLKMCEDCRVVDMFNGTGGQRS